MSAAPSPPSRAAGLLVAAAQWLATPGDPAGNLEAARHWVGQAAAAGADMVVLPELWPCGYDVASLASDAAAAAEPVPGRRTEILGALARRYGIWVFAGSVPERDGDLICNTALVFNRDGALAARHRKAHLYVPTGEDALFAPGGRLTSFTDPELGHVAVTVCFDGDFPEVGQALAARGADLVIQPSAYEWEARAYWDRYYPAAALANGQWWVLVNQCGPRPQEPCSAPARSSRRRARCSPKPGARRPPTGRNPSCCCAGSRSQRRPGRPASSPS
jgi:predicted amidohydrolase